MTIRMIMYANGKATHTVTSHWYRSSRACGVGSEWVAGIHPLQGSFPDSSPSVHIRCGCCVCFDAERSVCSILQACHRTHKEGKPPTRLNRVGGQLWYVYHRLRREWVSQTDSSVEQTVEQFLHLCRSECTDVNGVVGCFGHRLRCRCTSLECVESSDACGLDCGVGCSIVLGVAPPVVATVFTKPCLVLG